MSSSIQSNTQSPSFPPAMIASCMDAIDSGIYDLNNFKQFVLNRLGGPDLQPKMIMAATLSDASPSLDLTKSRLHGYIANRPRGQFALARVEKSTTESFYCVLASMGQQDGVTPVVFETFKSRPTEQEVAESVVAKQILSCRETLLRENLPKINAAAVELHGFKAGMVIDKYWHPGEPKPVSAIIASINVLGQVTMHFAKKKGSTKIWSAQIGAATLATVLGLAAQGSIPVLDHTTPLPL